MEVQGCSRCYAEAALYMSHVSYRCYAEAEALLVLVSSLSMHVCARAHACVCVHAWVCVWYLHQVPSALLFYCVTAYCYYTQVHSLCNDSSTHVIAAT